MTSVCVENEGGDEGEGDEDGEDDACYGGGGEGHVGGRVGDGCGGWSGARGLRVDGVVVGVCD